MNSQRHPGLSLSPVALGCLDQRGKAVEYLKADREESEGGKIGLSSLGLTAAFP